MCCTRLAANAGPKNPKNSPPGHHRATSQLRQVSKVRKNLLNSNTSPTCPHNIVNFGPLMAAIRSGVWGHPSKFQRVSRLGSITTRHSSSGRQPNFAELNRGCHLYSAGRPITLGIGPHSSLYFSHHHHHVACPPDVAVPMSLLHACRFCARR